MRCAAILVLLGAACASPAPAPPAPPSFNENSLCSEAPPDAPVCRADLSGIDEAAARLALGDREFAIVREDARHVAIFARATAEEANVCCSLQGPMSRLGESDLFAARYRLDRLDEAALSFVPPAWLVSQRPFRMEDAPRWNGPNAPAPPGEVEALRGERFERALWSEHLQETRRIYIYLPPGFDRTREYPVLFMADGASAMVLAPMIERLIVDRTIAPVILVGAGSGQSGIVEDRSSLGIGDLRAADYLPGYRDAGDRYEQHLRFFSEELVAYATAEFNIATAPEQRGVSGFSNGGSFSLFAALRRPDVFGVSIPLSPSWRPLSDDDLIHPLRARFFLAAGLYEIGRHRRATSYAETLRTRGYDVVFETPAMGHARDQEVAMLARFLPLAFPPPE